MRKKEAEKQKAEDDKKQKKEKGGGSSPRGRGRCESGGSVDSMGSDGSGAISIVHQQRQNVLGSVLRVSKGAFTEDD